MSPQSKSNRKRTPNRSGGSRGGAPAFGGGAPNVAQLMRQAQKMQEQMEQAQAGLADVEVTGSAGGGVVTATMTGAGELVSITIGPAAVDPDDIETLQDLVVAAVRAAARAAQEASDEAMADVAPAGGLPGLPGGAPGLPGH